MLYYIMVNFHTSGSNSEQVQKGNNSKNHEAVVIKYPDFFAQNKNIGKKKKKVKWKIEKLHMLSACPQKYPKEPWKSYVLYWCS